MGFRIPETQATISKRRLAPATTIPALSAPDLSHLKAAKSLGGQVANISTVLQVQHQKRQAELDTLNANEIYYGKDGFKDQVRQISEASLKTSGKNAENVAVTFAQRYDILGQELIDKAETDGQKAILQNLILKGRPLAIGKIATYQLIQDKARRQRNTDLVITDATRSIMDDPEALNSSLDNVKKALQAQFPGVDISPELFKVETKLKKLVEETNRKHLRKAVWESALSLGYEQGIKALSSRDESIWADLLTDADRTRMIEDLKRLQGIEIKKANDAEEDRIEEVQKGFIRKNKNDELTSTDILSAKLPFSVEKTWLKVIDEKSNKARGGRDAIVESEPGTYLDLLNKAHNNEIKDIAKEVFSLIGTKLTDSDAEHIRNQWNIARKPELTERNRLLKQAEDLGQRILIKNFGNLIASRTPEDEKRAYKYSFALREALKKGEEEGKSFEAMLTPNSKDYIVDKLIKSYQPTIRQKMEEEAARFKPQTPGKHPPPKEEGETPKDYLDRLKRMQTIGETPGEKPPQGNKGKTPRELLEQKQENQKAFEEYLKRKRKQ